MRVLHHNIFRSYALVMLLVVAAAACTPQTPTVPPTPTLAPIGTFMPQQRDVPTLPPPAWVNAGETITLENAPRLSYIGRLDAQGSPSTLFAYAFSPDGARLVGLNNLQIVGWNLISGQLLFNTDRLNALQVYYGADKDEIYTVDGTGQIRIYDAESGVSTQALNGQPAFNGSADYDSDNGLLALAGSDGSIKVWDVANRQSLVTINAHTLPITDLAFSSDHQRLASVSADNTVKVWDWRSRQPIAEIKATASKVVFAPDNTQLAVGENRQISIWSPQNATLINTLTTGPRAPTDVLVYSPDGQYIVNGGSIQSLTVWDTQTGKLVNTLPGAGGEANAVAFSGDGTLLATSVLGGDVILWDVTKLREDALTYAALNIGTRQILYTDWSPDGFVLLLVDATGPVQLWGIPAPPSDEATATPAP
ncbi:MAG: WD40 repeat domain-containing protein [Anaerolineae bacterium]|nr:WD40 repeat domain-containing protein [Anaerolineae bacterium]